MRRSAPGQLLGGLLLLALGAPGLAQDLEPIVLPPGDEVRLRVGEERRFSATVSQADVEYAWALDGRRVGDERRFEYRPTTADIGTHRISVTVLRGGAAARRSWRVVVEPPPPPKVVDVHPEKSEVTATGDAPVVFRYRVESSVPADRVQIRWLVDGTEAGTGSTFRLAVDDEAPRRVRAVATSELGVVQVREWRIRAGVQQAARQQPETPTQVARATPRVTTSIVQPPTTRPRPPTTLPRPPTTRPRPPPTRPRVTTTRPQPPPTRPRVTTTRPRPPTTRPRVTTTRPRPRVTPSTRPPATMVPRRPTAPGTPPPTTVVTAARRQPPVPEPSAPAPVARAVPPPPPPPSIIARSEVEELLERYARAYETSDIGELRRIGQVQSERQAEALTRYLDGVRDLDVEILVLEMRTTGETATVRFRRTDRFRDPAGRLVDKRTPPIEKSIRRTPAGLTFMPRS